jgi:DNA-binding IclR family transcriptional regulator
MIRRIINSPLMTSAKYVFVVLEHWHELTTNKPTVSEIARQAQLDRATVRNSLNALQSYGYVDGSNSVKAVRELTDGA